ncbi:L,D-transpeptidase [Actinokineospora iranica]|uniref:L,D-transpeptidase catalytic domain n=1 Tax=Actinokineospora iranica TaxID=1271860 RepID=A0A1G6J754_9PSEU|nr:L,D-transpeptidase [Actinokineospora iranica]SDC14175.1 L,D-transpeptidase catalytic domain [Actinokineospora iranica]
MGTPRIARGAVARGVISVAALIGAGGILAAPAASAQAAAPCGPRAAACIDLSDNAAWLMDNGTVTYGAVPITTGKPGYETPPGTFSVTYKDIDHWSKAYDAPMPYSVFFTTSGIAFHEGSLREQSHGCVHLSPEAAKAFFDGLTPGDVVEVVP